MQDISCCSSKGNSDWEAEYLTAKAVNKKPEEAQHDILFRKYETENNRQQQFHTECCCICEKECFRYGDKGSEKTKA